MAKAGSDKFANMAAVLVTESAANTLTFQKLETGIAIFEKVAWVISRWEVRVAPTLTNFADTEDSLDVALTCSQNLSSIATYNEPCILAWYRLIYHESGTPANFSFFHSPTVFSYADMPGGGLIVPPNPLYLGVKGAGLAGAQSVSCRFWYSTLQLTPDEYWELVEARRIISS